MPTLPLTLKEINEIKSYIKKHHVDMTWPIEGNDVYIDCPFHDRKNKRCKIYPVRPLVCRKFICSNPEGIIDMNRKFFDRRADVNGDHLDRFVPMDLLFYNNPTLLLLIATEYLRYNTPAKLNNFLIQSGADIDFFKKTGLPNAREVYEALKKGDIKLEWSDDND